MPPFRLILGWKYASRSGSYHVGQGCAASIGDNVTILQGVTLGTAAPENRFTVALRPVIGNNVTLGAGAKVIGGVTIGDYAKVGANAVVLQDVPPHATAVGVPARIILRAQATDKLQDEN